MRQQLLLMLRVMLLRRRMLLRMRLMQVMVSDGRHAVGGGCCGRGRCRRRHHQRIHGVGFGRAARQRRHVAGALLLQLDAERAGGSGSKSTAGAAADVMVGSRMVLMMETEEARGGGGRGGRGAGGGRRRRHARLAVFDEDRDCHASEEERIIGGILVNACIKFLGSNDKLKLKVKVIKFANHI